MSKAIHTMHTSVKVTYEDHVNLILHHTQDPKDSFGIIVDRQEAILFAQNILRAMNTDNPNHEITHPGMQWSEQLGWVTIPEGGK